MIFIGNYWDIWSDVASFSMFFLETAYYQNILLPPWILIF